MTLVAYMESHDYHDEGEKIDNLLDNPVVELNDETRRFLKIKRQRMATLKKIEAITGHKARVAHESEIEIKVVEGLNSGGVANDNGLNPNGAANDNSIAVELKISANDTGLDSNVAAFVPTVEKEGYIVEHTLDNFDWALHAWRHELGHIKHLHQGTCDIELEEKLSKQRLNTLQEIVGDEFGDIAKINLLEGFNDANTMHKHGANDNSGYNHLEVPAAKKLEQLCMKETGQSLVSAFDQGNMDFFYELLRRTCDIVRVKKFLAKAA